MNRKKVEVTILSSVAELLDICGIYQRSERQYSNVNVILEWKYMTNTENNGCVIRC